VLSVRSRDHRPIALLGNYSLHYVGGIPAGGVSADYFGEYARLLEAELGGKADGQPAFVGIMSNGTSGDVNNINFLHPRPRAEPFERMKAVAKKVADKTLHAYRHIEHKSDVTLGMEQTLVTFAKRRPTPSQVKMAKTFLATEDESKLPPRAHAYARWTLELNEPPHEAEIVLQAVRIGELGITSIPCETFAETGLEIKEKSPFPATFTIELANGHYGYLPTPRQHELGGYETWLGTNELEKTASVKITETLLKMLGDLKRQTAE
jgi:hypothetical protein